MGLFLLINLISLERLFRQWFGDFPRYLMSNVVTNVQGSESLGIHFPIK
jgi:hypothetical protein